LAGVGVRLSREADASAPDAAALVVVGFLIIVLTALTEQMSQRLFGLVD